jgi:Bax protein
MNKHPTNWHFGRSLLLGLLLAACSPDGPAGSDGRAEVGSAPSASADNATLPEVVVFSSEEFIPFLESEDWWGPIEPGEQLKAPHLLMAGINPAWQVNAQKLPVQQKKEIFYRIMLPLVLHANQMVRERRARLQQSRDEWAGGGVSPENMEFLRRVARVIPEMKQEHTDALGPTDPELDALIDDLLYRIDVVPPGLALGQAAYESGYGTSRFAVEGNSLFGQWTYGGDGITPKQKRESKGDYGIKAFDWPFDSVRGYFINLMSHRAYEDFRRLRADLKAAGKPLSSLALADGLLSYSERGQEYVDSLKGMIRVNGLDRADDAVFRDEPIRFLIGGGDAAGKAKIEAEIERMRKSGELQEIVDRMRLD